MSHRWTVLDPTPVGPLYLEADGDALARLWFGVPPEPRGARDDAHPVLEQSRGELEEYFARDRREFTIPLAPGGTAFQRAVWEQLRAVPYGTTASYGEIARRLGDPKLSRAVGAANGRNPLAIVVPCHRVVAADGKLQGFGGGLANKRVLLDLEAASLF